MEIFIFSTVLFTLGYISTLLFVIVYALSGSIYMHDFFLWVNTYLKMGLMFYFGLFSMLIGTFGVSKSFFKKPK